MLGTKKITESDIEHVKTINLITYLERLGYRPEYKYADKAMFFSPLRAENYPSFWVSKYNGSWRWKDWGTGEYGDIIKFVEMYREVDFLEAVRILLEEEYPVECTAYSDTMSNNEAKDVDDINVLKVNKIKWIRDFYRKGLMLLDDRAIQRIRHYFESKGVRYYPSMGCIYYNSFREEKFYIGIPIPFPEKIRGLECRGINGMERKTLGCKTLWVLKRDTSRVLVAESILDALAGEIVLNDSTITLCSINGVGNIEKVEKLVKQYNSKEVFFALDNDEPGLETQERGIEIVKPITKVHVIDDHIKAGVKDLHKLIISQNLS